MLAVGGSDTDLWRIRSSLRDTRSPVNDASSRAQRERVMRQTDPLCAAEHAQDPPSGVVPNGGSVRVAMPSTDHGV